MTENLDKLAYCHVPKVASTSWMFTFAKLNGIDKDEITNLLKSTQQHDHMASKFAIKIENSADISNFSRSDVYTFTFVRHPFERLVFAFHDQFIFRNQLNFMEQLCIITYV